MVSARGISRCIGITFGFIGMVGLVLSIVSLLPLNGYNIYMSVDGLLQVICQELKRTGSNDWTAFSLVCKLYIIYFSGTILCSTLEFCLFMMVCCGCRKQHITDEEEEEEEEEEQGEERRMMIERDNNEEEQEIQQQQIKGRKRKGGVKVKKTTLFNRVSCLILILQIAWALFGTHLYFYFNTEKNQHDLPATIDMNFKTTLCILWLNYLTLTLFAIILFCASFFILLGGKKKTHYQDQHEETRPLIL